MHKFRQKNLKLKFKELEINIMKILVCKQLNRQGEFKGIVF